MAVIKDFARDIPGGLNADRTAWDFPVVKSTNAYGKDMEWRIRVFVTDSAGKVVKIRRSYLQNVIGKPGDDVRAAHMVDSFVCGGKVRNTVPTYVDSGKNIGRANETNKFCQALRDAYGMYTKQTKRAAGATPSRGTFQVVPPMLASVYDRSGELDFDSPIFVQRKYNGLRCVTVMHEGGVIFYGRGKKQFWGFADIAEKLRPVFAAAERIVGGTIYLDGELYSHGMSLQEVSGITRRESEDDPDKRKIGYQVYDCFIPSMPEMVYADRNTILDRIFAGSQLRPVETFLVRSQGEIDRRFRQFLAEGYEGLMIRLNAPYRQSANGHHSSVLLKMKPTMDHEYRVVAWETGLKGKTKGALMIVCVTEDGIRFAITPAMTIDERVDLAEKMATSVARGRSYFAEHWLDKMIIVYFDEKSNDGVPLRARTKLEFAEEK